LLLLATLSVVSADLARFPLKKRDNAEFVAAIKERAAKGIKPSVNVNDQTGSVVIND
jgi:hypothetical protein